MKFSVIKSKPVGLSKTLAAKILLSALIVFLLVNLLTFLYFGGRVYPATYLNDLPVGNTKFSELQARVSSTDLLPESVVFSYGEVSKSVKVVELDLQIDIEKTAEKIKKTRKVVPVLNLFGQRLATLRLSVNESKLETQLNSVAEEFKKDPANAEVAIEDNKFTVKADSSGFSAKPSELKIALMGQLEQGHETVEVPVSLTPAEVNAAGLQETLTTLQKQTATSVKFIYQSKTVAPSQADMVGWYEKDGSSYKLSEVKIKEYLAKTGETLGIYIKNTDQAVKETIASTTEFKPLEFTLDGVAPKKYSYCTSLKGVGAEHEAAFIAKLASVLADSRGWSIGGKIKFTRSTTECNFTAWLSAANLMSTFGGLCDSDWSCRSGNSVVINFDRWQGATTAWNNAGGNLEDYRVMVTNHEVGHWLGFGHLHCSGTGQLAPVMQQQSMNLEGCKFNPWPLNSEKSTLASRLSL